MKRNDVLCLSALCVGFAVSIADATVIQVEGTAGEVSENPFSQLLREGRETIGGSFARAAVGTGGNALSAGFSGLLFFELPRLPASEALGSAELMTTLSWARAGGGDPGPNVTNSFNVDLYFLGTRNSLTINKPDDYGELNNVPIGATLVQEDWWLAGDNSQLGTSKVIDVTSQIGSSYTGHAPNDSFVVFGLFGDISFHRNISGTYFFDIDSTPNLSIATFVTFDCNEDGVVNFSDVNCTSNNQLDDFLGSLDPRSLRGDATGDGIVQFQDFGILADNFGMPGQYTEGDFDKDGIVQFPDFVILANNFGRSGDAVAAVPEPSTGILSLFCFTLLVRRPSSFPLLTQKRKVCEPRCRILRYRGLQQSHAKHRKTES